MWIPYNPRGLLALDFDTCPLFDTGPDPFDAAAAGFAVPDVIGFFAATGTLGFAPVNAFCPPTGALGGGGFAAGGFGNVEGAGFTLVDLVATVFVIVVLVPAFGAGAIAFLAVDEDLAL